MGGTFQRNPLNSLRKPQSSPARHFHPKSLI